MDITTSQNDNACLSKNAIKLSYDVTLTEVALRDLSETISNNELSSLRWPAYKFVGKTIPTFLCPFAFLIEFSTPIDIGRHILAEANKRQNGLILKVTIEIPETRAETNAATDSSN